MSNIYTPLPPTRLHTSHPISPASALSLLSTYILSAETDASLQPNSTLTESGPVSATSGAGAGLIIHNLKRVEAGLKGEQLGEDPTLAKYGGEGLPELLMDGEKEKQGEKKRRRSEREEVEMGEEGWVEREEFERGREEENVQEADVGERVQGVQDGEEAREMRKVKVVGDSKADKEARKRAKKERGKAEKKEREKKRLAEKEE